MGRTKDLLWKHVEKLANGHYRCRFCYKQIGRGITRIKWHLSGLEGHDIRVCEKVRPDVRSDVLKVLDTSNKKEKPVNRSKKKRRGGQVENANDSVPSSSGGLNVCEDNVLMWKKLAHLFYSLGIHPMVILSPIFDDLVKKRFVENGPRAYQLASTISDNLSFGTEVQAEVCKYIENFKNDSVQEGCTLMVNIWECIYDYSEVVVRVDIFAYSKKGAACFGSYKYEQGLRGLQEFISSKIDEEFTFSKNDEDLPYPNLYFRCNVPAVQLLLSQVASRKEIDEEFSKIRNYYNRRMCVSSCAAFEIDAILLKMESDLGGVIALSSFIFNTYQHYKAEKTERPKEKYAYIFVMLKKVLEIADELQGVPFSCIIGARDRAKMVDEKEGAKHLIRAKFFDYINCSKEFWNRVKAVEQVWFLLFQTRCLVNCKDSSIGYLYQMIERLKDGIEKSREYDQFVYDLIWERFVQMRSKIIHPIHAAAALLDPAYMYSKNFVEKQEMIDGTKYMLEYMVDSNEKEACEKELGQYRKELSELNTVEPEIIDMLQKCHPRTWWEMSEKQIPVLRKYAIRILAQPCSTSLCKRYQMPLGELSEDWKTKVNTIIINENSKLPKLERIFFDKLVEDHDAFKDVRELDYEGYIKEFTLNKWIEAEGDIFTSFARPLYGEDLNNIFNLSEPSSPSEYSSSSSDY